MNLNKAFILGNLTRDPEIRTLPSGDSVASLGIATNRFWTSKDGQKQQEAEFHNVTAFSRLAEICSQFLTKGSLVLIEGRLRTRSWEDKSGIKHFRTEIIAQNIQLAPKSFEKVIPSSPPKIANKQEEIPVIEEDYSSSPVSSPSEKEKSKQKTEAKEEEKPTPSKEKEGSEEQEIDVKDIPF